MTTLEILPPEFVSVMSLSFATHVLFAIVTRRNANPRALLVVFDNVADRGRGVRSAMVRTVGRKSFRSSQGHARVPLSRFGGDQADIEWLVEREHSSLRPSPSA